MPASRRLRRPFRQPLLVFDLAPTPLVPFLPLHAPPALPLTPARTPRVSRGPPPPEAGRGKERRGRWRWLALPPVVRVMLAGAVAEMLVVGLLYPLDTQKTLIQAGGSGQGKMSCGAGAAGSARAARLWRGLAETLPWTGLDAGIFSGVLEGVRRLMDVVGKGEIGELVGGGVAAVVSWAWYSPVEVIRDRMRVGGQGWREVVRGVMREGVGGFWKGAGGRLVHDLPFEVLEFGGFEWGLRALERSRGQQVPKAQVFALGMVVGGAVGALVSPVEFGVTRVVCRGGRDVRAVMEKAMRDYGWKVMFTATREVILREAISSGLYFVVYDALRRFKLDEGRQTTGIQPKMQASDD